jgi:beta-lactamase superfamily II metal-dependent hydrolase
MRIESLLASKGDCFIVTWNHQSMHHTIVIDSGIKGTYRFIKEKLKPKSESDNPMKIDGIFITHVDYDHIGGLLNMVDDDNCPVNLDFPIYINTPELIIANNESDMVNYGHGTTLEKSLNEKKIDKKALYTSMYDKDELIIHGLKLTILSPNLEILTELKDEWTKTAIYEKYKQDSEVDGQVCSETSKLIAYNEIIEDEEELHDWKDDLINSSSMAFLLEKDGVQVLFLGDSNPFIIENALIAKGYSCQKKLKVNLVKISHHGSKFNTSKKLLSMIDCDKYLISTDGTGPYYHPHRETIIKLSEYSRTDKEQLLTIYTNYDLDKSRFITPEEEEALNLKIERKNEFSKW